MNLIQKVLWYIESHSQQSLTLDGISQACGVSTFHLTRMFAENAGLPLMRYVRARRLSAAARCLVLGADDILQVALDADYGSHEAFTRAFREQFGLTPEMVRAQGHLDNISLTEEFVMNTVSSVELAVPRFDYRPEMQLVGLVGQYNRSMLNGIPNQWQQFVPHIGHIPKQVGRATFGVSFNHDEDCNFDYMCAVEVNDARDVPKNMKLLKLAEQCCAIFMHTGHASGIRDTFAAIWGDWLPNSQYQLAKSSIVERLGADFDGQTGLGGVEIWLPVIKR